MARQSHVEHAILDKNVVILEGATVGVDKEHDRARDLTVSPGGVTVVGRCRHDQASDCPTAWVVFDHPGNADPRRCSLTIVR